MKVNAITTIISVAISAIVAYCLYSWCKSENEFLLCVGGFLSLGLTMMFTIGVSFEQSRTTTNIRFLSGTFFVLLLISNMIFAFVQFSSPTYVLVNGLLLLIWLLVVYGIKKANM
jgi:hypothetical protein